MFLDTWNVYFYQRLVVEFFANQKFPCCLPAMEMVKLWAKGYGKQKIIKLLIETNIEYLTLYLKYSYENILILVAELRPTTVSI